MEAIDNAGPQELAAMLALGLNLDAADEELVVAEYRKEIQQRNAIALGLADCREECRRLQMILEDDSRNPDLLFAAVTQ